MLAPFDGSIHVPFHRVLFEFLAFVVQLSAFAQSEQYLGPAEFEIHFERNQSEPFFKGAACEAFDLAAMDEQFSRPFRFVIESIGLLVFGDFAADEPDLVPLDPAIGVFERDFAVTQAFHFAPHEHHAAFERLEHFVLVARATVVRDELLVVAGCRFGRLFVLFCHGNAGPIPVSNQPFNASLTLLEYSKRLDFGMTHAMIRPTQHITGTYPAVQVYLLGTVDFASTLALQQRLVFEASGSRDGQMTLLLCEHPPLLSIGRQGSRTDVRIESHELAQRNIETRWVNRGGGAILHQAGQLAVYPIVPLEDYRLSVGEFQTKFLSALRAALVELGVAVQNTSGGSGVWGRTGLLAASGLAVKNSVSYFGAYLNVEPCSPLSRWVLSDLPHAEPMSSLAVERRHRTRMTTVREAVIRHVCDPFTQGRYHIHSRHPWLVRQTIIPANENSVRA